MGHGQHQPHRGFAVPVTGQADGASVKIIHRRSVAKTAHVDVADPVRIPGLRHRRWDADRRGIHQCSNRFFFKFVIQPIDKTFFFTITTFLVLKAHVAPATHPLAYVRVVLIAAALQSCRMVPPDLVQNHRPFEKHPDAVVDDGYRLPLDRDPALRQTADGDGKRLLHLGIQPGQGRPAGNRQGRRFRFKGHQGRQAPVECAGHQVIQDETGIHVHAEGAGGIGGGGKRVDAFQGETAEAWLDAHDAVERRGDPAGAGGVGTQGAGHDTKRHADRAAGRGSTGQAAGFTVPYRVERRVVRVQPHAAERELAHVGPPEEEHPRRPQVGDDRGILGFNRRGIPQRSGTGQRPLAPDIEKILERHRDTFKWTGLPGGAAPVDLPRLFRRPVIEHDKDALGIQRPFVSIPDQRGGSQLAG